MTKREMGTGRVGLEGSLVGLDLSVAFASLRVKGDYAIAETWQPGFRERQLLDVKANYNERKEKEGRDQ